MRTFIRRQFQDSIVAIAVAAGCFFSNSIAFGNPFTFTIDSSRSSLTLSLNSSPGVPITSAQFPGSDTVSLSGTQKVDLTSNSITFLSTSNAQFGLQPSPVSPAAGGIYPGSAPANYGLLAYIPGLVGGPGPGGAGLIAVRGFVGGVFSNSIPLVGTSFAANNTILQLANGLADANLILGGQPFVGTDPLSGNDVNQRTAGTLTRSGQFYTLTLPIFASSSLTLGPATVLETYVGQLVATAPVPEPATWVLAVVGGAAIFAWRRGQRSA